MRGTRQRGAGLPGIALLIALLLVPVALSGHRHATHGAQSVPCATCLSVLHTPAANAAPVAHVDPVFVGMRVCDGAPAAQHTGEAPLALGRAPPVAPVTHFA